MHGGMLIDDEVNITKPELRSLQGLWRIWTDTSATQQYYPILHSVFWLQYKLWGGAMFGYHLANVFLHAVASGLIVAVVRRLALPGAWLAGFIFALHPVCVESVAWISEQKNTLSTVFYLASALAYFRFDQTRDPKSYRWATAFFVLALLSKTVTVALPPALLVVFWWQRGKLEWSRDVKPLLPWFVVGIGVGLFCTWVEHKFMGAKGADFELGLIERGLVAGRALWFYVGKLVWPADLLFMYPRWSPNAAEGWQYGYLAGAIAVVVGLILFARKKRGPLAAFLIFAGTLAPMLGFLNIYWFVFSFVSDHFVYTPCIGLIIPVAVGLTVATRGLSARVSWLPPLLAVLLLGVFGFVTWQRNHIYRDSETICRDTLARNPTCWMFHNNLGVDLTANPEHFPEAIAHFQEALRIRPTFTEGYYNLANTLEKVPGRIDEAIAAYETAIKLQPNYTDAHYNLGNILVHIPGRMPEAAAHYEAALRQRPNHAEAHHNLGNILAGLPERSSEALAHFEAALKAKPDYVEAHNSLGGLLLNLPGRTDEAITHFETALRINPNYAEGHCNLASALLQTQTHLPEAIEHLQTALKLRPDFVEAHFNLGNAFAGSGRMPDAVAEYETTTKLRPDFVEAHFNLGCALAEIPGRKQEAIDRFNFILRQWPDCEPARQMLGQLKTSKP